VDIARRDAGIDQDALLFGPQVVAIAAAARAETAEYQVFLCHFLPSNFHILCQITQNRLQSYNFFLI
jgi:hypothetical protein